MARAWLTSCARTFFPDCLRPSIKASVKQVNHKLFYVTVHFRERPFTVCVEKPRGPWKDVKLELVGGDDVTIERRFFYSNDGERLNSCVTDERKIFSACHKTKKI
jgi:hypothetical protein